LGLKVINPDEECESDNDNKPSPPPMKIPFANETRFSDG